MTGPVDHDHAEVYTVDVARLRTFLGKQGQQLTEVITASTVPGAAFSVLEIDMPPGWHTRPHVHAHADIAVRVLSGRAITLLGYNLGQSVEHGPGEWVYIPAGVPHAAVNLSDTEVLTAVEVRSRPDGDADTEVLAHLERRACALVRGLRARRG